MSKLTSLFNLIVLSGTVYLTGVYFCKVDVAGVRLNVNFTKHEVTNEKHSLARATFRKNTLLFILSMARPVI